MAALTSVTCKNKQCKKVFQARTVDVNRGWGKFCSKSCKAIEQENRTGQYKSYCSNKVNGLFNKQDNRAKNDIETDFSNGILRKNR